MCESEPVENGNGNNLAKGMRSLEQIADVLFPFSVTKGTTSFGKRHTKTHTVCRRCNKRSFHRQHKLCASCGFPAAKIRSYEWGQKAKRRRTTGTGRMRSLKEVPRRCVCLLRRSLLMFLPAHHFSYLVLLLSTVPRMVSALVSLPRRQSLLLPNLALQQCIHA